MAHFITDDCISCANCIEGCPVEAISEGQPFRIDADLCIDCGACAVVCPADSILNQAQRLRHLSSPPVSAPPADLIPEPLDPPTTKS